MTPTPAATAVATAQRVETAVVAGTTVRVSVAGQGPPLLLLPGMGSGLEMWEPLRARLAGRTTVAFDAPGIGRSPVDRRLWTVGRAARLASAVVDRYAPGVVPEVLGYSFGGLVAQHLARLRVVARLVLVATTAGQPAVPPMPHRLLAMLQGGLLLQRDAVAGRGELGRLFGGRSARDPVALGRAVAHLATSPPSAVGYYGQALAASTWTGLPWIRLLTMPALVLAGGDDRLVPPANARLLAGLLPDARLCILAGAGHLLVLDDADRVADEVLAFLAA
ncbi:MAG: alpha/beta fold hydrolase [Acidimicrobiia bacterium]